MNGLLQKLNETVVTRRSSTSGSTISSTFGSVFSTTASSTAAAAAAAATQGVPTVIYPCSIRPIPFTVPTFPATSVPQSPGRPTGRSIHHEAEAETGGSRPSRAGSTDNASVDNYRRADVFANYPGKKLSRTVPRLEERKFHIRTHGSYEQWRRWYVNNHLSQAIYANSIISGLSSLTLFLYFWIRGLTSWVKNKVIIILLLLNSHFRDATINENRHKGPVSGFRQKCWDAKWLNQKVFLSCI